VQRSRELGEYLGEQLRVLANHHQSIGDVRGLGLFWAVELVKNRTTKKPFNTKDEKISGKPLIVEKVAAEMAKSGVAINPWVSHFVIAPPLIIEKHEIDLGVSALDKALAIADGAVEE
jgi:taurine---2-oxoglutarate transaminase